MNLDSTLRPIRPRRPVGAEDVTTPNRETMIDLATRVRELLVKAKGR